MAQRYIRPTCVALLFAAFALDLVTPQLFVAAILLNVPIALSSLVFDRRFTQVLIAASLVANVIAGYANGAGAGYHWDAVAIGDRIIAGLSFLLVGLLSVASQSAAKRAGELSARQDRAMRERAVSRAVEAVRVSVNPELILRAIAREAVAAFDAKNARVYAFDPSPTSPTTYSARAGTSDVDVTNERPPADVVSLLERLGSARDPVAITGQDPLGRMLLATLGVADALAVALVDRTQFGVLVVGRDDAPFDAPTEDILQYFAQQSSAALSRAALFVQLAARNHELAEANAALVERSDVIREIVFAMSHDLRTPLAAAGMTMRQALAGAFGPVQPAYAEILRRTIASNDELQRLAETLLLVARYESGDNSTRREPVDLTATARDVAAELEPLWKDKNITLSVIDEGAPVALGDPSELRRALVNLVANAVTFTPSGGTIAVRTSRLGERAVLAVEDDGFGVPPAERAQLFERLPATGTRVGAGSGLGLYIVRRIAESHGGTASYAPRDGGGSIFRLDLPFAERAP